MAAARYTRFALHLKHIDQPLPGDRTLRGMGSRVLVGLMWPVGALLYMRDRARA